MDTITQITLGAAVGEAVLGRKIGYKAPLAGAVFGVVPDLDILANPFLNEVQQIIAHRGISHSILFCLVTPPLFGWLLSSITRNRGVGWKAWSWLIFLVFLTHIFIDVCTSYGTQVFQPFSDYALSFNSIFIVDPFYTVPLLIGITCALFFRRDPRKRRWANYLGLGVSTLYLVMGFGLKWHVNTVFEENFRQDNLQVKRYMTTPAPLTEFLWTGYAESEGIIYAGIYSVFDDDRHIQFHQIPKNTYLIEPYLEDLAIRRLLWFSNGYYSVSRHEDGIYFTDLRFGRSDFWLSDSTKDGSFVWNYRLEFNADSSKVTGFRHLEPSFGDGNTSFGKLLERILGD